MSQVYTICQPYIRNKELCGQMFPAQRHHYILSPGVSGGYVIAQLRRRSSTTTHFQKRGNRNHWLTISQHKSSTESSVALRSSRLACQTCRSGANTFGSVLLRSAIFVLNLTMHYSGISAAESNDLIIWYVGVTIL